MKKTKIILCLALASSVLSLGACGKKHSHSFTEKNTDAQYLVHEATCTETAQYYYSCKKDGEKGTEKFTVGDPLGHNAVIDAAVAPTCTKEGKTEGSHCSRCNEVIKAQKTIEIGEHDYHTVYDSDHMSVVTTYNNYVAVAEYSKVCSVCGEVKDGDKERVTARFEMVKKPTYSDEGIIRIIMADGSEESLKIKDDYNIPVPNLKSGFWTVENLTSSCKNTTIKVTGLSYANPNPPIGPFYGSKSMNITTFCKRYNTVVIYSGALQFETTIDEWHKYDSSTGICSICGDTIHETLDLSSGYAKAEGSNSIPGQTYNVAKIINASGKVQLALNGKTTQGFPQVQDEDGNKITLDSSNCFTAVEGKVYYAQFYANDGDEWKVEAGLYSKTYNDVYMYCWSKEEGGRTTPFFNNLSVKLILDDATEEGLNATLSFPSGLEQVNPGEEAKLNVTFEKASCLQITYGDTFKVLDIGSNKFIGYISTNDVLVGSTNLTIQKTYSYSISGGKIFVPNIWNDTNGNYYYIDGLNLKQTTNKKEAVGYEFYIEGIIEETACICENVFMLDTELTDEELAAKYVGKKLTAISKGLERQATIKTIKWDTNDHSSIYIRVNDSDWDNMPAENIELLFMPYVAE